MRTSWQAFSIVCLYLLALSIKEPPSYSLDPEVGSSQELAPIPGTGQVAEQGNTPGQPEKLRALLDKAGSFVARRENKEAQPLYREALQIDSANSIAHAGLGWALFDTGKRTMGISEERKALELDQNNALAHHYLANMYLMSGHGQKAADEYRMEYKIAPNRRCHCGPIEQLLKRYPPQR